MYLTYFLVTFLLSLTSEARECSLSSFDRCGPAQQAPGTQSTCNATITNKGINDVYTAKCIVGAEERLNKLSCVNQLRDICNRLTDRDVISDQWVWSNAPGCSLGFWLPSGNGSDAAFAPDFNRCKDGIFGQLINYCTEPSWNNVGSVNLNKLPDREQTGKPVNPYYPSYVIAPAQLT
ncbi:MAG: hypothetical protein Q9210_005723, partial [Variospora velana]